MKIDHQINKYRLSVQTTINKIVFSSTSRGYCMEYLKLFYIGQTPYFSIFRFLFGTDPSIILMTLDLFIHNKLSHSYGPHVNVSM